MANMTWAVTSASNGGERKGDINNTIAEVLLQVMLTRTNELDDLMRDQINTLEGQNTDMRLKRKDMERLREVKNGDNPPKDIDAQIENLRGDVETIVSTSQLETIKLQNNSNHYNNSFDLAASFINKYQGNVRKLIGLVGQ